MKSESSTYHRRSIRFKGYDYSSAGAYFLTIMPNHLHSILYLRDLDDVGAHCNVPLQPDTPQTEQFGKSTVNSIPTIIKLFKSTVTKQINELRGTPGYK